MKKLFLTFLILGIPLGFISEVSAKNTTTSSVVSEHANFGDGTGVFFDANYQVTYYADVYNADTGTLLNDGDTVPVNTRLRFVPKSRTQTGAATEDIYWNFLGEAWGTPYGYWESPSNFCHGFDFIGSAHDASSQSVSFFSPYIVKIVPEVITPSGVSGVDEGGNIYRVTSGGTLSVNFKFPAVPDAYFALSTRSQNSYSTCQRRTTILAPVSEVNINFSFNVAPSGNTPPPPPTITGPTTGAPGTHSFSFLATDPESNTIRYGIDWDNNSTIDAYLPSSGYVASNTSQSGPYSWSTPGTYTFQALTQDVNGASSGWSSYSITITSPSSGDCRLPSSPAADAIIDECALSTSGGYRIGQDFDYAFVVNVSGGDSYYRTCHNNQFINQGLCSNGEFVWDGDSSCQGSLPVCSSAPTASLTINASEGPLNVALGTPLTITWSSTGATSCTAFGAGWGSATPVATTGTSSTTANQTDTYILQCTNGTTTVTDSVQVNLTNTLKVCHNTCDSGTQRGNFTLSQGGSQNLVSCFNAYSGCTNSTGNVTSSTTWTEASPAGGAISLTGTDPKTATGINPGSEGLSASYSSQTQNIAISVSCIPTTDCSNAPGKDNYCQNENFSVDNGCGVSISCTGTKTCDFNWKEVAP